MKTIKVTQENFEALIEGVKKYEVRRVSETNLKNGDTIIIEEYNEYTDEKTYRFATAKIYLVEEYYDSILIFSLNIIDYIDEKGVLHNLPKA